MDLESQHPVVEELLTNKYFGDTLLVCANGHLTDNKLAVGLLFPCLLSSDIFALPIENVLLVPDYTMEVTIPVEDRRNCMQTFWKKFMKKIFEIILEFNGIFVPGDWKRV